MKGNEWNGEDTGSINGHCRSWGLVSGVAYKDIEVNTLNTKESGATFQ